MTFLGLSGTKYWYLNGERHRKDGPAVEQADGTKHWYLNDELHREDGPAVEYTNGTREWWLNGKELTKRQLNSKKLQKDYPELYHSWVVYNVMNQ